MVAVVVRPGDESVAIEKTEGHAGSAGTGGGRPLLLKRPAWLRESAALWVRRVGGLVDVMSDGVSVAEQVDVGGVPDRVNFPLLAEPASASSAGSFACDDVGVWPITSAR